MNNIDWQCRPFKELDVAILYEMMALRQNIFIVEQQSPCPDIDYFDQKALHLMGYENGRIAAYARIFPPGVKCPEAVIGRVAVHPEFRKFGLGSLLMKKAMAHIKNDYGAEPIRISAQAHLADKFYGNLGFRCFGGIYDEDGIPHVGMMYRVENSRQPNPHHPICPG